jgi:hypothetical protein
MEAAVEAGAGKCQRIEASELTEASRAGDLELRQQLVAKAKGVDKGGGRPESQAGINLIMEDGAQAQPEEEEQVTPTTAAQTFINRLVASPR